MITKADRNHIILAIFFISVGIGASVQMGITFYKINDQHAALEQQIKCNDELTKVLQIRSDARTLVDLKGATADQDLAAALDDVIEKNPSGPDVLDARKALRELATARNNPDLWEPYPKCTLGERK